MGWKRHPGIITVGHEQAETMGHPGLLSLATYCMSEDRNVQ